MVTQFFVFCKCPVKKFEVKGIAHSKEPKKKKKFATGVSLKNWALKNFFIDKIKLAQRSVSNDLIHILPF